MAAFASPTHLPAIDSTRSFRRAPVCVLNQERTATPPVPVVTEPKRSTYYQVLDGTEDPKTLPPPPPRHHSIPILGYYLEGVLGLSDSKKRTAKYGPLYMSNFLLDEFVYVNYLPVMSEILRDTDTFSSKLKNEQFSAIMGNDNIIMLDGPRHQALRGMIAPAFSPSMFASYFKGIKASVDKLWTRVSEDTANGKKVKLDPLLRRHYMGLVIQMTSGLDSDSELVDYLGQRFMGMMYGFIGPTWGPLWDRSMRIRDEIGAKLRNIVLEKLRNDAEIIDHLREVKHYAKTIKSELLQGADVMHVALSESELPTGMNAPTDDPQIETVVNLMFIIWMAGFFTSAATTACATFEMGMDETGDIMRRLTEEQDALVSKYGAEVTLKQVNTEMPLLNSYVAEIMRMFPAADGIARIVEKDVVLLGRTLRRGTTMFFDLRAAFRDQSMYPEPDKVVVDRFLAKPDEEPAMKNVAFGDPKSPHYCVGAALAKIMMKTTLATLLRNYTLALNPRQSRRYKVFPDMTPASNVEVRSLKRRAE